MVVERALDAIDASGDDSEQLLDALSEQLPEIDPDIIERFALPYPIQLDVAPRVYQREALQRWLAAQGRGVVVLPTGAGKTVVAMMAMEQAPVRTLVVVPTIELLQQWRKGLQQRAGIPADGIGVIGGGERKAAPVTVITYDSAVMPQRKLNDYGLLVVDEVHHLPAPTYRAIARKVGAPLRLGLSATPERSDGGHEDLAELIGPEVYRRLPAELAQSGHIANYQEKRLFVDLTLDERTRYDALMAEFTWYLATKRGQFYGANFFQQLVHRAAFDPAARRALQAHHQARLLALNAHAKIGEVERLLEKHREEHVLIFSEYTSMVREMSQRLLIPAITYRTDPTERRMILDRFRSGRYTKLVSGRVLNEGVDVPDANVAIVVSGSSATREYIQRLGRVLRPKPRSALLYEIISRKTVEGRAARSRRPQDRALAS